MSFRLARALRAHLASAARFQAVRKNQPARTGITAEPLEDRRLLTVSIDTPYQQDVEAYNCRVLRRLQRHNAPNAGLRRLGRRHDRAAGSGDDGLRRDQRSRPPLRHPQLHLFQ